MKLKVKVMLNPRVQVEMEFEAPDIQDVIKQACPVLAFNGKCGLCGEKNITLRTLVTKANEKGKIFKYTEYACLEEGCGGTLTWGKRTDGTGFYLRNQWEKYIPRTWDKYTPMTNEG